MSDAIRDVTIRVKIEQVDSTIKPPDFSAAQAEMDAFTARAKEWAGSLNSGFDVGTKAPDQISAFKGVADVIREQDAAKSESLSTTQALVRETATETMAIGDSTEAVERNFRTLINQGLAEGIVADTKLALSRSAMQAAGAAEIQAGAMMHVSAVGARAATANAAVAITNVAVGTTAVGAAGGMAMLTAAMGPIAIGIAAIAAIALVVQLGTDLWSRYGDSGVAANDKIAESAKRSLKQQQDAAQLRFAIVEEEKRRKGLFLVMLDREAAKRERLKTIGEMATEAHEKSAKARVKLAGDDPEAQNELLAKPGKRLTDFRTSFQEFAKKIDMPLNAETLKNADLPSMVKMSREAKNNLPTANDQHGDLEKERVGLLTKSLDLMKQQEQSVENRRSNQDKTIRQSEKELSMLQDQLKSVKDRIDAENDRMQSAAERFAMMDPGEQMRLKDISLKAQKGGQLDLEEAKALRNSGLGQEQASSAFSRIAEEQGFGDVAKNIGENKKTISLRPRVAN